jgi:hypothetical protein
VLLAEFVCSSAAVAVDNKIFGKQAPLNMPHHYRHELPSQLLVASQSMRSDRILQRAVMKLIATAEAESNDDRRTAGDGPSITMFLWSL